MLWKNSDRVKRVPRWRWYRRRMSESHGTCFYCYRKTQTHRPDTADYATRDHYWPRSKGGRQCVLACHRCNQLKADQLPDDFIDEWEGRWEDAPEWPFVEVGFFEKYMAAGRNAHYARLSDNESGTSATDDAKEAGKTTGDNT